MKRIPLGNSQLFVSRICMGCMGFGDANNGQHSWTLDEEHSREIIRRGLELGVNFFDTAIGYQSGTSEQYLGRALRDFAKREDVVVATKFLPRTQEEIAAGITGQQHIEQMVNTSLKNLGMDYIDLYIYHMWDHETPLYDIMDGLNRMVKAGKVRYIGISNMTIPKLEAVLPLMKIKPAACELELHVCFQQQELFDYLVAHNIQPVGYMPLGSPRRPERDICPEDVADLDLPEMKEIAAAHGGLNTALVSLKWAHQRGEIAIPFSVHHYADNLKCVTEDPLTEEEMKMISTLEKGNRLVKGQVFLWEGAKDWHDLWDEDGVIVQ